MNLPTQNDDNSEIRDAMAKQWNRELLCMAIPIREKLSAGAKAAALEQDADKLKRVRHAARSYETQLSRWNDGLAHRACPKLIALQESFGTLADDINAGLNGGLPGQQDSDPSEDWKKGS